MIVTVDELRDYMSDISLSADQESAAEIVIAGVQTQLEQYFARPVERVERTEMTYVDDLGYVRVDATPVISVSSITIGGLVTNVSEYTILDSRVRMWSYGIHSRYTDLHLVTGLAPELVVITYTGGIDGHNAPDIKLAILEMSSRIMTNKHDDVLTTNDLSTTGPRLSIKPEHFTAEELAMLDRHRLRIVV